MIAFQVMFPNGSVLHGSLAWPAHPDREMVEDFVIQYLRSRIRHLVVQHGGRPHDMFVSELAAFRLASHHPDFALNHAATAIYREALLGDCPSIDEDSLPTISGAAVLFEQPVMSP